MTRPRLWSPFAMVFALTCPATAHAHGGEQIVGAYLMILVAVVTIPLAAYVGFSTVFAMLKRVGIVRIPKEWALGACVLLFVAVFVAPGLILPLPLRVRIAAMNRLFPNFQQTGFRQSDVPGLIDMLLSDGDFDSRFTAGRILSDLDAPLVPLLIAKLDSPDDSDRENAIEELESIGPSSRAAIPRLIRILAEESDPGLLQAALSFLAKAAEWEDRQGWAPNALPQAVDLLREADRASARLAIDLQARKAAGAPALPLLAGIDLLRDATRISEAAANVLGAMKSDGVPALPALREALDIQRAGAGSGGQFERSLLEAITSICSSLVDDARDRPECQEPAGAGS